jgi:hypothetical protein
MTLRPLVIRITEYVSVKMSVILDKPLGELVTYAAVFLFLLFCLHFLIRNYKKFLKFIISKIKVLLRA